MKFFQQSLLPDPLGPILVRERKSKRLSLTDAARIAGISPDEAAALEEDRAINMALARLHAVSYARALGIDTMTIRESLPPKPGPLVGDGQKYLSRMGLPKESRWRSPLEELHRILAPLGRGVLYLLFVVTLLSTWGMMRQLSRVRSIPWITSNSQPAAFSPR
jgi:cytoskeletal protein RodZ